LSAANAVKDAGSTRERILDTALELFAQHGFAGTSMRTLARATGLRESSIYNHFAGKEDIYQSVIAGWGPAEFVARLSSAEYRALADQPVALFALCARHLIDRWLDPKERLFTAMISTNPAGGVAQKRYYRALFYEEIDLLEGYFAGFSQRGLIRACDARESARMFAAGLTFIRMEHVTRRREPSTRSDVEAAVGRYLDNFTALLVNPAQ
jgi:AcrR family transcriptional regulator